MKARDVGISQRVDNTRAMDQAEPFTAAVASTNLAELFGSYHGQLLAYCARRVGRDEAEDIAAEVFAIAARRQEEISWDTALAWLYGIARGVLANKWRSRARHARLLVRMSGLAAAEGAQPDDIVVRREEDQTVLAALARLGRFDREVLMLAAWENLSAPKIAAVLGISADAAEQRLRRAKRRLARVLDP